MEGEGKGESETYLYSIMIVCPDMWRRGVGLGAMARSRNIWFPVSVTVGVVLGPRPHIYIGDKLPKYYWKTQPPSWIIVYIKNVYI